tara:strand:+ start:2050 stop:2901 length:852 start_codon:yes stop_codon:yes gene_type:complete
MQISTFDVLQDFSYSDKRVMIGLSGGINSAAALIYLSEYVDDKPEEIYLYYSHLVEHSPDTKKFVLDLVEYAKKHFDNVVFEMSEHSMNQYCIDEFKGIPHPSITPCTKILKLNLMIEFMAVHKIDIDIVGYVRSEYKRIQNQINRNVKNKDYLISHLSDEDCFFLTKKHLGWYPDIYDLKWNDPKILKALTEYGKDLHKKQFNTIAKYHRKGYNNMSNTYRVFKHNNCLPCKNMHQWEIFMIRIFYPKYYDEAMKVADQLNSYWGRKDEDISEENDCVICVI